ncbi:hypothetical protein TVAG_416640 [Trichomonas vaginalis G3]|uniref:Viral A-type inclusion protein n=1 Tax=Trichomonas vaginalis (strain ATCC PRA-98 / G3) TaxID=412133 RepID=A2EQQ6_TRIV3|nr:hypothetical protein TVAGG3_0894160 [Trichomonas vaginalis G3]EAY05021.1 hypothetical protein TVAG_416640 [Trichomonas vaginalis G3]KAI5502937.1 hypothetical protein TVAGG3_0894160 [Trichomonas vaginalis G3]|eukprot:XP_001317244.1 hypothetical protein [Trichomonas vaginalis G3]
MNPAEAEQQSPHQEISEVDADRINAISSICNSFDEIPPELVQIAKDNQDLKTVAENVHAILSGEEDVKFTSKDRKILEQAICTLAYHSAPQASTEQPNEREQNNQIKDLRQQLVDSNEHIKKLEQEIIKQNTASRQLQSQIEALKSENSDYFNKLTQADEKNNKLRKDNNNTQTQLKAEITQLQDTIQELRDQVKMSEISVNRLNQQVEQSNKELSEANVELNALKSSAESKRIKIKSYQQISDKLRFKVQELEADKSRLLTEQNQLINSLKDAQEQLIAASPENIEHLEHECDGYKQTIEKLQELTDFQANDIIQLRSELTQTSKLLQKQTQLLQAYDSRIEHLQNDYNDATNQISALNNNIENLQSQVETTAVKSRDIDCSAMLDDMDPQTKDIIEKKFGDVSAVKLPDVISSLVDSDANEELKAQNARLISALENQLRFLQSASVRGVISTALLSPESASDPLIDDKAVRDKMLIEIARTKQFITNNKIGEQKLTDKEVKSEVDQLEKSDNLRQREAFAVIALESENNDILRRHCDKLKSWKEGICGQLNSVREPLHIEGEIEDSIPSVVEFVRKFQNFAKQIKLILDGDYNEEDIDSTISFITKYCQSSSLILKQIDNDLRQAVKFDGELVDLPIFAVEVVNDLLKMITAAKEQSVADMRSQMDRMKEQAEQEQEKLVEAIANHEQEEKHQKEVIDQLMKKIDNLQQKNNKLQSQNKDFDQEKQEVNEKLNKMMANYQEIESSLEESKEENERMREQMNKKSQQFEQRLEQMLQQQREQHSEDLNSFEEKLKQREEKLQQEIQNKHNKLQETKQKLREVIQTYDAAFKQQKEATAVLRQQNQELIMRLQTRTEQKSPSKQNITSTAEVEQLKTDVKTLKQEKAILESKLEQTITAAENARQIRESYWESQLSQSQQTMERSIQQENIEFEQEVNDFKDKLKQTLSIEEDATNEKIVDRTHDLVKQLEQTKQELETVKKQKSTRQNAIPPKAADIQKVTQTVEALQEWDRWARDLYSNVTDGDSPCQSAKDLRFVIGEMALSSIGHRQLMYRLESLRAQKKALINSEIPNRCDGPLKMRSAIFYVQFAFRIMRKSGNFGTN